MQAASGAAAASPQPFLHALYAAWAASAHAVSVAAHSLSAALRVFVHCELHVFSVAWIGSSHVRRVTTHVVAHETPSGIAKQSSMAAS